MRETLEAIAQAQASAVARLARAVEVLGDVARLQALHEAEGPYLSPPFEVDGTVGSALSDLSPLIEDIQTLTWALVAGLPRTTAAVCARCKHIVLRHPSGAYKCRPCARVWWPAGAHLALPDRFWERHKPGDKYHTLLPSDAQEELLKRGSA